MTVVTRISELLALSSTDDRNFPATDLYNEGWMLRLVLDWFSRHPNINHPLSFSDCDKWYSEALLPSAFLPRYRGDRFAESWTHADGAIGDIVIGEMGQGDLSLAPDGRRLVITEAKMFSRLSPGVTRASFYDQASRNVACIAEVAKRAGIHPTDELDVGFYVLAPLSQIEAGVFSELMTKESIRSTVTRRVEEHEEPPLEWYESWFTPLLGIIDLREISWEDLALYIAQADPEFGSQLEDFYDNCLTFNTYVKEKYS